MTGCDLAVLERHSVMEFLERRPDAWPRLVKVLCERLRTTDLHIAEGRLVPLLGDWSPRLSGFYLYYSSRRQVSGPLRAFIEFLTAISKMLSG